MKYHVKVFIFALVAVTLFSIGSRMFFDMVILDVEFADFRLPVRILEGIALGIATAIATSLAAKNKQSK